MIDSLAGLRETATLFGIDWIGLFTVLVVSYLFIRVSKIKQVKWLDPVLPIIPLIVGILWAVLTVTEGGVQVIIKTGIYVGAVAAVVYKLARPMIKKMESSSEPGE